MPQTGSGSKASRAVAEPPDAVLEASSSIVAREIWNRENSKGSWTWRPARLRRSKDEDAANGHDWHPRCPPWIQMSRGTAAMMDVQGEGVLTGGARVGAGIAGTARDVREGDRIFRLQKAMALGTGACEPPADGRRQIAGTHKTPATSLVEAAGRVNCRVSWSEFTNPGRPYKRAEGRRA